MLLEKPVINFIIFVFILLQLDINTGKLGKVISGYEGLLFASFDILDYNIVIFTQNKEKKLFFHR